MKAYMVSYAFNDGPRNTGFGSIEITSTHERLLTFNEIIKQLRIVKEKNTWTQIALLSICEVSVESEHEND